MFSANTRGATRVCAKWGNSCRGYVYKTLQLLPLKAYPKYKLLQSLGLACKYREVVATEA